MAFYIYCVVPPEHEPATVTGIDDVPVQLVQCAGLGLWTSQLAAVPEASVTHIRQHNAVVEQAISDHVTPVPVRFGQWAADRTALDQSFEPRAENFRKLLALFAGSLEFGLRILDPSPPPAQDVQAGPVRTGREYLVAVRDRLRPRPANEAVHERVQAAVASLVKVERVETQQTPHIMVSYAHLVARSDFERYRSQVQKLREELTGVRFLVSGPWPPYSFAT